MLPCRDRAQFLGAFHRRLHPAPCSRDMRLYESALADVPVGQCSAQSAMQLRMHRHKPCLAALARTYSERRTGRIQRQVTYFEVQRLRDSQTRPPLLQHQQLRLRTGRGSDDRIHLVGFEIFRYALLALGGCAVLCFWITSAGPAPAGDCGGGLSGHTCPFSTAAQSRYMHCRQFVTSDAPGAYRTCHSWTRRAPPSRRSAQSIRAFRPFLITNRDNSFLTQTSWCHGWDTGEVASGALRSRRSLRKCTSGLRSPYAPCGPCTSPNLSPAARLAASARLTTFGAGASRKSRSSYTSHLISIQVWASPGQTAPTHKRQLVVSKCRLDRCEPAPTRSIRASVVTAQSVNHCIDVVRVGWPSFKPFFSNYFHVLTSPK